MEIKIRTAKVEDAEKLLDIYSYYVKKTAVTFEYEVPSVEEFQERIRHISCLLYTSILQNRSRTKARSWSFHISTGKRTVFVEDE